MNIHHINWFEMAVHTVSFFSALTFAIAVAHRLVQIAWESFSQGYPNAPAVVFMSPTGPLQKALTVTGDFTSHLAQLGRELVKPKTAWDGVQRRSADNETQAQGATAGR